MPEDLPDNLQAGRELDRLIAKRFDLPEYSAGAEYGTGGGLPIRYSRDTPAAMELLKMPAIWSIECDRAYQEAYTVKVRIEGRQAESRSAHLPLAICRAVLMSAGLDK